ncbi:MAG: hypothetical protein JWM05_3676, partial [Acidimicrobiales bacterium]|nr:hypothetical protein [Acidimicrobiales bacterium]
MGRHRGVVRIACAAVLTVTTLLAATAAAPVASGVGTATALRVVASPCTTL